MTAYEVEGELCDALDRLAAADQRRHGNTVIRNRGDRAAAPNAVDAATHRVDVMLVPARWRNHGGQSIPRVRHCVFERLR